MIQMLSMSETSFCIAPHDSTSESLLSDPRDDQNTSPAVFSMQIYKVTKGKETDKETN